MATLWVPSQSNQWRPFVLQTDVYDLGQLLAGTDSGLSAAVHVSQAVLVKTSAANTALWVLLTSPDSSVSLMREGIDSPAGIRVLKDKAVIRIGLSGNLFFSEEVLAAIETFPGMDRQMTCPRCKQAIGPQTPAVRCPSCGTWYHQTDTLPCYSLPVREEKPGDRGAKKAPPQCVICGRISVLNGEYTVTPPEGL